MRRKWSIALVVALVLASLIAGLGYAWKILYVVPHVERFPDPLRTALSEGAAPADHHFELAYDLVEKLDAARFETPRLTQAASGLAGRMDARPDPRTRHPLARLVTLGSSSNYRKSLRAIHLPTPAAVAYNVHIPDAARLEGYFGLLPEQPGATLFKIFVNGKEALASTEKSLPKFPHDESAWFYKQIWSYIHVELTDREARWSPFRVDLSRWAGQDAEIRFTAESQGIEKPVQAFIGAPAILAKKPGAPRPVILYLMDAMSTACIGAYGSDAGLTPEIDGFASRGVMAKSFVAAGNWSRTGASTLMTGRSVPELLLPAGPSRRRINHAVRALFEESGIETLATLFRKCGYRSVAVANNVFLAPSSGVGADMGFDLYTQAMRPEISTMAVENFAARTLAEFRDENVFLYVHQNAPNTADTPPQRFRKAARPAWKNSEYGLYRYLACVAQADFTFGRFLKMLDAVGWSKTAILAVSADHGQVMNRVHEIQTPDGIDEMRRALYFHGQTLYDEELKVPFIIRGPDIAGGRVLPGQHSSLSLFPTLLHLAGITVPSGTKGADLSPFLLGRQTESPQDEAVFSHGKDAVAVRIDDRYKYIRWSNDRRLVRSGGNWRLEIVREELFDIRDDPDEKRNLSVERPELLMEMRRIFDEKSPPPLIVWALSVPKGAADEVRIEGARRLVVASGENPTRDGAAWIVHPEDALRLAALPDPGAPSFRAMLFKDGSPLAAKDLRFGVALTLPPSPEGYLIDARDLKTARARFVPPSPDGIERPHLCLMEYTDWIDQVPEKGKMDSALRSMLRQWGYVQ